MSWEVRGKEFRWSHTDTELVTLAARIIYTMKIFTEQMNEKSKTTANGKRVQNECRCDGFFTNTALIEILLSPPCVGR